MAGIIAKLSFNFNFNFNLVESLVSRLLEMSSVAENNRIIPAIDKLDN